MKRTGLIPAILAMVLMAAVSWLGKWAQPTVRMVDIYPRQSLQNVFPTQVGGWRLDTNTVNMPLSPDVEAQIKAIYTETYDRSYVNDRGDRIMVTVAYGRDQSDGFKVHRPEVCYAAQGFEVKKPREATLDLGERQIQVMHVDTHKESRYEPVTYWMVIGDTPVDTATRHKLAQIRYAFHGLIADGMLVRVSSISRDSEKAYAQQAEFVRQWRALVPKAQRARLFGT